MKKSIVNLTIEDLNFQQKMCKDYFVNKCFGSSCYIFLVFSMHVIYAELSGDFPLGDSRQPTYKSLRPFDLVS